MCRYLIDVFGNMMEEFGFNRYYILGIFKVKHTNLYIVYELDSIISS